MSRRIPPCQNRNTGKTIQRTSLTQAEILGPEEYVFYYLDAEALTLSQTGGRDTAGMGGRGGYKRLYKGHNINQVGSVAFRDRMMSTHPTGLRCSQEQRL